MVVTRGEGSEGRMMMVKGARYVVMEGDCTWGGEHTKQYIDVVLWNYELEIYIMLLTSKLILEKNDEIKVHFNMEQS